MITLQTSFSYAQGAVPPVDTANITVQFPQFSFDEALVVTSSEEVIFEQPLANPRYRVVIPTSQLFGPNYGAVFAKYITALLKSSWRVNLKDLSVTFSVSYGGQALPKVELEGLYWAKLLSPQVGDQQPSPQIAGPRLVSSMIMQPRVDPSAIVDANIYLINKKTYRGLLTSLFPNLSAENESILLYLLNVMVDLGGSSPALSPAPSTDALEMVLSAFDQNVERVSSVRTSIARDFPKLFDFPLDMVEVRLLKIAGFIGIEAENVQFNDFTLCNLSVEITTGDQPRVIRYDWDKKNFRDNRVHFSLPETIVQNSVRGNVVVKVTAFDNSSLYYTSFKPSDPTLQNLEIIITPKRPTILKPVHAEPSGPTKLRGQVVSLAPKPETLQGIVVIQAKKAKDSPWITIASASSDRTGNFSMPYPSGAYASAQAIVSLDPENVTRVGVSDKAISPDFIYILIKAPEQEPDKKDDCKCEQPAATGRLPSQEDLIQSDQFTQDIGGSCLNLNTPNRTLKEYNYQAIVRTSDPDVANYTVRSVTDDTGSRTFLKAGHGKVDRKAIDLDNPVRWQDDEDDSVPLQRNFQLSYRDASGLARSSILQRPKPEVSVSLYQSVTVATGHILHYKSEFKADGYSLGDLLYSVPLAPGQKKQIVIFDASHSLTGTEDQSIGQTESLANNLLNERSIVDQIAGNIGEAVRGQSDATTSGVSAAAGASGSSGFIGASAGVAGGYSNANSTASQDSNRNLSQYFSEMLRQRINQNASSYRKLTASAVTTVREGQQYNAETSVIANHNHCHSLTMMYFEVLRHFAVFQELVDVEECVFVPLLMTKFTNLNVSKWSDALVPALLPLHSNTYLTPYTHPNSAFQHPLVPAFDAIERIRTKYTMVDYPQGAYDLERIRQVQGSMQVHTHFPRPKSRYDFIMSLPLVTKTVSREVTDGGDALKTAAMAVVLPWTLWDGPETHTVTEEIQVRKAIFETFMSMDANFASVPPAQSIRINSFITFNFAGGTVDPIKLLSMSAQDEKLWQVYAWCLDLGDHKLGVAALLDLHFKGQLLSEWDSIFEASIAPRVFRKMMDTVGIDILPVKMIVDSQYNGGERYMDVTFSGQTSKPNRFSIGGVWVKSDNDTAKRISGLVTFNLRTLHMSYSTNHYRGLLFSGNVYGNLLGDAIYCDCPESSEEKRDPRKEDIYIANRLIEHLNFNLEYYNRALWYSLDADRRWLLLDGFKIQTFDKHGNPEVPESFRSLASVLKNSLIAVAGNSLVFPVAPGFRVNRALIIADGDKEREGSLLDHYQPLLPSPPYRLSVPTRGVYMEAVMGSCNSCEKVQLNTSQDWTKFTTDEPTSFAQVTPPVPVVTDYKAAFEKLANPIISIQNAPTAPDPGAGLAAATDLLGKAGLFKDITGLDANQANAIKTYLSNNDNVRSMAQMASALAMQSHNTANSSLLLDTMGSANATGALPDADYQKLVNRHFQQQIDGGAAADAQLKQDVDAQKPSLEDAAVQAVKDGRDVKAVKTDSDGNTNSIDVKGLVAFAVPDDAGADGGGGSETFDIGPEGDDIVQKFKDKFAANPSILTSGQFVVTDAIENAIKKVIDGSLVRKPNAGLQAIWNRMKVPGRYLWAEENKADVAAIKQYIADNQLGNDHQDIVNLYKGHSGTPSVRDLYHTFWAPDPGVAHGRSSIKQNPTITTPTFDFLTQSYNYEKAKCGSIASLLARKYAKNPLESEMFDDPIAVIIDPPNLPIRSEKAQTFQYPDVFPKIMEKVKTSLTKKLPVIAGVMSGANHVDLGTFTPPTPKPKPEHFVLIFDHSAANNAFYFWDPDTLSSNLKSWPKWGAGFGVMFYRNKRLSTAFSEEDLKNLNGDYHKEITVRHRYQAYYLRNAQYYESGI